MKTFKKIALPLLLIITIIALSACGCSKKPEENKPTTDAPTFQSVMEQNGYTILDVTNRFAPEVGVSSCLFVRTEDPLFEIGFYAVETEKQAKAMCDQNKQKFENFAEGATGTTEGAGNNIKYSLTAKGRYMVNSSIGNTFIYVDVPESETEKVNDILTTLGY